MKPDQSPAPLPFETLRFDPSARTHAPEPPGATSEARTWARRAPGYVRLDRHLARWQRSSTWLGLSVDLEAVVAALNEAAANFAVPHRVRVTSTPDGRIEVSATPLPMRRFNDTPAAALDAAAELLAAGGTLPQVALARQAVDESDPARSHKTTSRDLYYAGRRYAEAAGLEDVLFLDSNGMVAEGSIATVFVVNGSPAEGSVVTPPLSSGALPGVLREELLDRGLVREQAFDEQALRRAAAVLIGSSVRGLRRVAVQDELVDVD
jgi:branched-subunit amino acid aminotransferase/4-amino-4-deoxychorismate lyase